ncbi:MAG: hypothetical protein K5985_06855 [Lachnospiraceae bacterium]|nr:hypothetical protein [Lachnospiraceae bacterium]
MLYPLFSYDDGTEVTASKPDENGKIFIYVEKFDNELDGFINATIAIPNASVVSSTGYSQKELDEMVSEYSKIQEDIISYIMDKVKKSA